MSFLTAALLLSGMIHNVRSEISRELPRKIPNFFIFGSRKLLHTHYRDERVKKLDIIGNKKNKKVK
jgi:hypothetical protein